MDYIINPMWVYWINVLGDAKWVSLAFAIAAWIVAFIAGLVMADNYTYGPEDKDYKKCKAIFKRAIPVAIIFTLAAVFIPTTKVMVEMMVARLATKENIELTAESLKSIVDYIAETIKSVK